MSDSIFDSYFVQTANLSAKNEVVGSTIRTARVIVLSRAGETPTQVGKAVPVATTGDLTVFGDVVRVEGVLSAPGRTIKIVCRQLEFYAGKSGSGISVSGADGTDGVAVPGEAPAGGNGQLNPTSIPAWNGATGQDGGYGTSGNSGGEIQIYCDILAPYADVVLSAQGGKGANGAVGQKGGAGGNGFDGYPQNSYDLGNGRMTYDYFGDRAHGGRGGCGGNGGDGGNGGAGGRITFQFLRLGNPDGKFRITANAAGGIGGDGAQPGEGAKGGNGGKPDPKQGPKTGAAAGPGGSCGLPGRLGYGGPMGTICLGIALPVATAWKSAPQKMMVNMMRMGNWQYFYIAPAEAEKAFVERLKKSVTFSLPEGRKDGKAGQPLDAARQAAPAGIPGPGREVPPPSLWRNLQKPDPGPPADNPQVADYETLSYATLAPLADADQLEMLFDFTRDLYLLANTRTVSDDVRSMLDAMTWIVMLLKESKTSKLLAPATATIENLRKGNTIFGKNAQFAALGTLSRYESALTTMLGLFKPVETTSKLLSSAENSLAERKKYLENVVANQKTLVDRLTQALKDKVAESKNARAQVQTLDSARLALADNLAEDMKGFEREINDKIHLTPADIVNLFSQLSFTNRELTHPAAAAGAAATLSPAGIAATGAMLVSQTVDIVSKAIESVPSDLGGSVNKKFAIRRMEYLGGSVKDLGKLKETRDGLLKADPSAEYRLMATRDQVESVCSNFYEQCPSARKIQYTLDQYIECVAARNEKLEEYNQLLSDVVYLNGELEKSQLQKSQAETSVQTSANPGLPAMARYTNALRRHAQERCIHQLYMASRVFTMQSLQFYDVFADRLGSLTSPAAPGEINSEALNTGLIDLISEDLESWQNKRTSPSKFVPNGNRCRITLSRKKNLILIKMLQSGKPGTFSILPPDPNTTLENNPFARMADVRLTHIRCSAEGMVTSDNVQSFEITHPGIETFVSEDGHPVRVNHGPLTMSRIYNATTGVHTEGGALPENHSMIGPFCEWIISIPKASNDGLDLSKLTSLTMEFEGLSRPFAADTEQPAGAVGA